MQRMLRKFFEEEFPLQNFFREAKCIKKCTLQFISLLKFSSCARKKKSRFKKMQHDAKKKKNPPIVRFSINEIFDLILDSVDSIVA